MKPFNDFVYALQISIKGLQLYSPDHPRSVDALQQLTKTTHELIGDKSRVQIVQSHGRVFIDRKPIETLNAHIESFIAQLRERRINGFVITRDIDQRELGVLVNLLIMKPARLEEIGGGTRFLSDNEVTHLRLSHTRFEELTEAEEVVDALYLAELSNDARAAQISREDLPGLIVGVFKPLLQEAFGQVGGGGPAVPRTPRLNISFVDNGEVEADMTGLDVDALKPIDLSPIENRMKEQQLFGAEEFEKLFTETMLSFDPETQARLLVSRDTLPEGPLREVLDQLAPAVVGNIVAALLEKKVQTTNDLPEVVQYLYSRIPAPNRSVDRIRARLESLGISNAEFDELLEVLTWEELDIDARIRRLQDGRRVFEVPPDRLLRFLRDLIVQQRHDDFLSLIERYGTGLTADSSDLRQNVVENFVRIAGWTKEPGLLPAEETVIQRMLFTHFLREPDPRLQPRSGAAISAFMSGWVATGKADRVVRALTNLDSAVTAAATNLPWKRQAFDNLLMQVAHDHVPALAQLLFSEDQDFATNSVYPILTYLGARSGAELIDLLGNEDDRSRRSKLVKAVKAIGKPALIPLRHALASPTWYLVRNALNLLGDLSAVELLEEVGTALNHEDNRVRRAAARALSRIGGDKAEAFLLSALPSGDAEMQSEIVFSLGSMKAESAIVPLTELLKPKRIGASDDSLRERAVEAIGLIGSPKGIPVLEDLLKRKGMFGGGESTEMRIAAAKALALINTPEAKLVIRKAVDSEPNAPARDQMAKLLETQPA